MHSKITTKINRNYNFWENYNNLHYEVLIMSETKKVNYNQLNDKLKQKIINTYYERKDLNFNQISDYLYISERAISKVLKEFNINTKRLNRYTLDDRFFEDINTEEKAYILGLLFADGFVGDDKYNNLVLHLKDRDLLEKVADSIKFTGKLRESSKGGFKKIRYVS